MAELNGAKIIEGIIIGSFGGAAIWVINWIREKVNDSRDSERIYQWLLSNSDEYKVRSTRTIASFNNLTEDRVRYICSRHEKIFQSTGYKEDMWGLNEVVRSDSAQGHD